MSIFSNFIPNEFVAIDDKHPPRMTQKKKLILFKKSLFISHTFQTAKLLLIARNCAILEIKFHN